MIRTINNCFALLATDSHFHRLLRTFTNHFAPSATDSHFRRLFRTFANRFAPLATTSHFYRPTPARSGCLAFAHRHDVVDVIPLTHRVIHNDLRTFGDRFAPLATDSRTFGVWHFASSPTNPRTFANLPRLQPIDDKSNFDLPTARNNLTDSFNLFNIRIDFEKYQRKILAATWFLQFYGLISGVMLICKIK